MWFILFNALDDFGIRELNDVVRAGSPDSEHPNYSGIESIKKKISEDALHGALRIAGLVSNRLDEDTLADYLLALSRLVSLHPMVI